jgi:long-chain acyl-CoA synthetase
MPSSSSTVARHMPHSSSPVLNGPERGTPQFWAASRPDAPAVIHGSAVLTYGEWNAQADRIGDDLVRGGFYCTGDVGHLDDDGFLFITDRIKDMIVAGGVNIYPTEIEKALVEHPDVINAAVIGIPHDDFGEQPLAFIVPDPTNRPTSDELIRFLDGRLASYKRPRQFAFVDELPLSPMGKVLKTELRTPYWEGRNRRV